MLPSAWATSGNTRLINFISPSVGRRNTVYLTKENYIMNYRRYVSLALMAGGLLVLSACTRSISHVDSEGKTAEPAFPDQSSAVRTEGSFVNLDNLKQMRPNLTKAQVYELLGTPHFHEGILRVKEWDYIFHFTKPDRSVLTCQYKVLFDSHMMAQSFYFHPQDCLTQLQSNKRVTPVTKKHLELRAETLFAFGSAQLSAPGLQQVQQLAETIRREVGQNQHVVITGYTDRIGTVAKNEQLSLARAAAVKTVLVTKNIPASYIDVRGLGSAEPRVICPGKVSSAVIACLAPNRRMTLDIVGE